MTVDARRRITALGGLGLALAGVALWMLPLGPTGGASPGRAAAAPSEAEAVPPDARGREIGRLQDHLRQNPEDARSWAALGFALVEQARVTADPSSYPKAEGAFDRSLELQPEGNFTALSGRGALANARHDFAAGLSWGEKARATNPDNAEVHGVIGDALLELGRYPEAFAAFQRMVDLRPGLAAYARVSYARELRGDVEGAREALEAALEAAATPADAAFAQHFLGELAWNGGDVDEARRRYELAARLDAGFVPPRAGLARLRAALGETDRAVEEWRAVVARSPLPEYVAELGNLYLVIGRTAEAEEQFALLEAQQRLLRAGGVNVDLEIALFNADHGVRLAEGLAAARAFDGRPLALRVRSSDVSFPPGQAGLSTLRLGCELRARTGGGPGERKLSFSNTNFADRLGWRETTAAGDGVDLVASDVPVRSVSRRLTRYPDDLLQSPLDQRRATLRVRPGGTGPAGDASGGVGTPSSPLARVPDRVTQAFTALAARQELTFGFGLFALAAAVVLGALHALAPGHGKTVMAAYLVGQRGSLRQAVVMGLTVTATHTAGVLLLGLLLSGSAALVPERLYPWLRMSSGLLLASVGAGLLLRALGRRRLRPAEHPHEHHHDDHVPGHDHHHRHHHDPSVDNGLGVSRRALVAMGAAGGMVPSPSALVVLLGAIALGRTWFGVALVVGYGVGMALSLLAAGLLLVRFRGALDGRLQRSGGRRLAVLGRALPVATATLVVVVGLGLAAQAAGQV